jgi:hypothetical protein
MSASIARLRLSRLTSYGGNVSGIRVVLRAAAFTGGAAAVRRVVQRPGVAEELGRTGPRPLPGPYVTLLRHRRRCGHRWLPSAWLVVGDGLPPG